MRPSRLMLRKYIWTVGVVWLLGIAGAPVAAMVPEDILELKTVTMGELSPDGRFLLYSIGTWDREAEGYQTSLFRRDLGSGKDRVIFTPADRSHSATWRPDGQAIAYLRATDHGTELWLMDPEGGDRRRISRGAGNFAAPRWSPDGATLAWIASEQVGPYEGLPDRYIVADDLGYRHLDAGYREGRLRQIHVLNVADGETTRLFDEELDVRSLAWSPDSRRLVFEAKARPDLGWNLNCDLWLIGRDGAGLRRVTDNPGLDANPTWLPDGTVAWMRSEDPIWESGPRTLAIMDPDAGDTSLLAEHGTGFDNFWWRYAVADGRFYILGSRRGCLDLVRIEGARQEFLTSGGFDFWSLQVVGERVVLAGASQTLSGGIFTFDLGKARPAPQAAELLIDPNAEWRRRVGLSEPEPFTVEVDGRTIDGWVFLPADLAPNQQVPLVLSIHGGPEWMYGGYFLPEFHILPSFGFGVIAANPAGSTGYGFDFQASIRGDWVDQPARDVLACVDHAVERGWADPQRIAVMGGSYGGHLAAELTTQTRRFRAAAVDRMYPDPVSFWGTTDEKWFPEYEFGGRPWESGAREVYEKNSPFERVNRVTTPTLISQGMRDYRCLIAGGEIWFSSLQALQVPARFIRFTHEGHGIRSPLNQVFYYNQLLSWFDRHVLGNVGTNALDEELDGDNVKDSGRHD